MKKKNCKLTSILRAIALPLVGSAGGWLYYRYVGCATGTCAVTSSPWLSTGFGCVLGSLLYTVLRPGHGKRQDGDETAISEAKDVLAKKGATYQNVYFASDGEAGKFTTNIFAYPTTYVVDRNGNIVGDPIVGAITEKKQAETLQKLIDQTLAADMG